MKLYNIYFSPTGGTRRVADVLARTLSAESVPLDVTAEPSSRDFSGDDVCLFAVPSFGGRVPAAALDRFRSMTGRDTKAVLLCVYGNRAYEDTLLELKNAIRQQGFRPVAAVAAIAEHSIMRRYAKGRPDAQDKAELQAFAERIREALSDPAAPIVDVPGDEPYKPFGGSALKPVTGESCVLCGHCVYGCPTKAIPLDNPYETDKERCITCMRCIAHCPTGARSLDKTAVDGLAERMKPLLESRKANELFI